jgi:hypothetical protein
MSGTATQIAGIRAYVCSEDGAPIATERDVSDLLGEMFSLRADWVVIPRSRLTPAFFDLKTRFAGEMLQKLVNYDRRVVILGDVSAQVAGSDALRDFVRESNRGNTVWFMPDLAALEAKLAAA